MNMTSLMSKSINDTWTITDKEKAMSVADEQKKENKKASQSKCV